MGRAGVYLYGLATVGAGILDLVWGEFEQAHQPIQALSDHIPGLAILAYVTAVCMIAAGVAILWRRCAREGALASAFIYLAFGLFWLPRFYTVPRVLGFRLSVFIGMLGGLFMQLIVAAAGLIVFASFAPPDSTSRRRVAVMARWIFGLGSILFGVRHLTETAATAALVPSWMPCGGVFWAVVSGVAFVLAGLAILSEVLDVPATRLLVVMVLIFELALVPLVLAHPGHHVAWGSNAYNLAAAGAIAIFAGLVDRNDNFSGNST